MQLELMLKDYSQSMKNAFRLANDYSKDPSTKCGAVILDPDGNLIGWGINRFPKGVRGVIERWERPTKYSYVVHAEIVAIMELMTGGRYLGRKGMTLVCTHFPCASCSSAIIEAGIKRVVYAKNDTVMDLNQDIGMIKFQEAGVEVIHVDPSSL